MSDDPYATWDAWAQRCDESVTVFHEGKRHEISCAKTVPEGVRPHKLHYGRLPDRTMVVFTTGGAYLILGGGEEW